MNPKIFVGVAVAALVAVLGGILLAGPSMILESQDETISETQNIPEVKPVQIELDDISVSKISERSATIEIAFKNF